MNHVITKINEFHSSNKYDELFQIRMDKIFDRIEDYNTNHNLNVEIKNVNFKDYTKFCEENLLKINDFVDELNKKGKIFHCDFPTFWVTTMDDLSSGPQIDNLDIDEINIHVEYKYTHVYQQYEKLRRGYEYELVDRYVVKYQGSTDEWDSDEILKLMEEGAFHSEHGVIGLSFEAVKECIEKI